MGRALTQNRRWRVRGGVLAAVLLCAVVLPVHLAAQCSSTGNLFLFGHSWFRGEQWMRTLEEHDVVVDEGVCALDIVDASFAGGDTANYAMLATRDGGGSLLRMVRRRASYLCGLPSLVLEAPRGVSVDLSNDAPFTLVNHPLYQSDSLLLVVAVAPLTLRAYTLRTSSAVISDSVDIVLSGAAGQQVRAVAGDADTAGGLDSGIWVVGDGGLIRHVPFDGAAWAGEQGHDIAGGMSFRCVGEGYAGTDNGSVFVNNGGVFVFDERPVTQPLHEVGRRVAVGANGAVAIRRADRWEGFSAGGVSYRAGNPIAHGNGSSVELIDSSWQYHLFTYDDVPTTLSAVTPAGLRAYVNNSVYALSQFPMNMVVRVVDPDSNQSPPSVELHDMLLQQRNLLVNAQGDTLVRRQPEQVSQFGVVPFDSDSISLAFTRDSIVFRAGCLRAASFFNCPTSYWARDTFRTSVAWDYGDMLVLAVGSDTLRLVQEIATGATARSAPTTRGAALLLTSPAARPFTLALPAGVAVAELRLLELFDARGRCIERHDLTALGKEVRVPVRAKANGVMCVRVRLRDGSWFSRVAVPLH